MATNDYAITNTLLQSLFGPSPEQQAQAYQQARDQQALQMAQLTPGRGAVFAGSQLAQDLGQSAQQLGGAVRRGVFGIETPKEIEDNVANQIKTKAQPLLQQGDMAAYADFLAQEYSKAGLTDRALRAKTAGDQFRMKQAELAKVRSEETRNLAQAQKAMQEQGPKFANEVDKALYEDFLIKAGGNAGVAARMYSEYKSGLRQKEAKAGVPESGAVKIQDIASANKIVSDLVDAPKQKLSTVADVRTQLNLVRKGEGAALPQLQRQLIKLVGDSQIAQGEVRAALGSAGIVGDTINAVNQFMTGVPTADKLDSVEKVINALEEINADAYNRGRNRAATVINEAAFSDQTKKALLPPEYKTGKQKKTQFVEGKIYTDAKGNRARYVNGKWEPVQ